MCTMGSDVSKNPPHKCRWVYGPWGSRNKGKEQEEYNIPKCESLTENIQSARHTRCHGTAPAS